MFSAAAFVVEFYFYSMWSESMQGVISVFLYLLRLTLCPMMWSILENVPWPAEKNVYCAVAGHLSRHLSFPLDLWCHLFLGFHCWFFCLEDLSFVNRGILKSPTTTVLGSLCGFKSFSICLLKLGALKLGAYKLIIVISSWGMALLLVWSDLIYFFWVIYIWNPLYLI
jgi:hypothetical protein